VNLLQPVCASVTLSPLAQLLPNQAAMQTAVRERVRDEVLELAARAGFGIGAAYVYWTADPAEHQGLKLTAVFTADPTRMVELWGGEKDGTLVDPPYDRWQPAEEITVTSVNGAKLTYRRAGLEPRDLRWIYKHHQHQPADAPHTAN
jgi:hypothetical protein